VELWVKVLDNIPNSRLLLKAKQFRDKLLWESTIQLFTAQGINSERIILEGLEDRKSYFSAYHRIDITLDPFPFTGGTTSVESLWMGVPLITLAGDSLVSRQGVGVLMSAGLPDWIADDEEEYLAKTILFASNLNKLAKLRADLRSQVLASPLFDAPRFAQNLENALLEMWNQWDHQS
jgi:predicted O-linked N-acetylglucosamine transferase (SPINDLY family)